MNKIGQVLQKKETILQIYLQCSAENVCSVNNAVSIKICYLDTVLLGILATTLTYLADLQFVVFQKCLLQLNVVNLSTVPTISNEIKYFIVI